MNFEVYCDESGLEALTRKNAHNYIAIGGIWMQSEYRPIFKKNINDIKKEFNIKGELKWNKVSPAYLKLYEEIIKYFFNSEELRFRIILVEAEKVNNIRFNDRDAELSFYKFYYQLLHHWIYDFNQYNIFLDLKENRNKGRLKELKRCLDNSNLTSDIYQVQGLPSDQCLGIQLADILTGLVNAKFNNEITSEAKKSLIGLVEKFIGKQISPSPKAEVKFNIFKINLQGGW